MRYVYQVTTQHFDPPPVSCPANLGFFSNPGAATRHLDECIKDRLSRKMAATYRGAEVKPRSKYWPEWVMYVVDIEVDRILSERLRLVRYPISGGPK